MFGWLINAIQRRESTKRVLVTTQEKVATAQKASEIATSRLREAISDRRAATRALQETLHETLARVRRR